MKRTFFLILFFFFGCSCNYKTFVHHQHLLIKAWLIMFDFLPSISTTCDVENSNCSQNNIMLMRTSKNQRNSKNTSRDHLEISYNSKHRLYLHVPVFPGLLWRLSKVEHHECVQRPPVIEELCMQVMVSIAVTFDLLPASYVLVRLRLLICLSVSQKDF